MIVLILLALLVALAISLLQFLYKNHENNKRLKGFVSPPGLPLLKHLLLFSSESELLPNLLNITRKYGGLVKVELFYGVPLLIVTDTNLVSHILGSNKHLEKDTFYKLAESWIGTGLITSQPEKWRQTRKIMNPAFNVQILERHIKSFENPSKILVEKLKREIGMGGFNILSYLSPCTLDILSETVMNVKLNFQENSNAQYLTDIYEETAIIIRRLFSPIKRSPLLYMFTSDYWKERAILKRIHEFTNNVINDRKKIKAMQAVSNTNDVNHTSNNSSSHSKVHKSLVDILLDATYNGRSMTNREIMDEVQTFLFAGHDTTAMGVSLVLYCLSKHQDVQHRVVEEFNNIFGNDVRRPNANDLNDMKYLDMVIKEAMRLYTPAPFLSRLTEEDISYDNVFIPKGMPVMIFMYGIHKNPAYYENVDVFDPSRFESDTEPFTFIPFSAGPRNCIGKRFALLEMKYLLCEIMRNFKILPVSDHKPEEISHIVLHFKNGVMIKLESR